jgi:hypothetical protein
MLLIRPLKFALIGLLVVSCSHPAGKQAPVGASVCEAPDSDQSMGRFIQDFRAALRRKDIPELCRLTRFPLDANLDGFGDDPKAFARHFDTLFPAHAVGTLLRVSPGSGSIFLKDKFRESWHINHFEPNKVSEMEWGISYCFSRCADGKIRLTAVRFAG